MILADNDFGLQAASFTQGRGSFWGVQYHPEYDYADIAAAASRYGNTLVTEGMFRDAPALAAFVADLEALQMNPLDAPLLSMFHLHLDTASVSIAEYFPNGATSVRLTNDTSHLAR